MNICHFTGNLTRDPEIVMVGETKKAKFGLAVNGRPYKNKSTGELTRDVLFMDCEAWASGAETIDKHFKKGYGIMVHGELRQDTWEDKETGQKRSKLYMRVNEFEFPQGDNRSRGSAESDDGSGNEPSPARSTPENAKGKPATKRRPARGEDDDTSDIPF